MTQLWNQQAGGWIGGDGAFSISLGDGRVLWVFGDSLIARDGDTWMARNIALLQGRDGSLTMLPPSATTRGPFAALPPPGADWLWPAAAVRVGGRVWLFLSEMRSTGPGVFGFEFVRTWLAELAPRTLTVQRLRRFPDASEIAWGAAVVVTSRYVYAFGIHNHPGAKYAHLARTPRASWPRGPWRYFDHGRWTPTPRPYGHVVRDVASQLSIVRVRDGYALLTHDPWLGPEVRLLHARALTGPWSRPRDLLHTPTQDGTFTYNTLAHPEIPGPGLLVSWNTGAINGDWWPSDPALMRPHFAWVSWGCLGGRP